MNHGIFMGMPSNPNYLLGLDGEVFSLYTNKCIKHVRKADGYLSARTHLNGVARNTHVHRLMAHAFRLLIDINSTQEVDHITNDKLFIGLSNLQVLSHYDHNSKTLLDKGLDRKPARSCNKCGEAISYKANSCLMCSSHKVKDAGITLLHIEKLVKLGGWSYAGRELNYSDNGLRKRYRSLGGDPSKLRKTKV